MADIFERLRSGEPIHMINVKEYQEVAHKEMERCRKQCFVINTTFPETARILALENELFLGRLPSGSFFTPPFQVDYACQMTVGSRVFTNHDLTCMSAGGIVIEDGAMIGPHASLLTVNHDFNDIRIIICRPVTIKKNAWLGAGVIVMPGVTIGEGAVVGSGSVVTHDVPDGAVAAGNPARILRTAAERGVRC